MSADAKSSSPSTRALLLFGILTGPVFFAVAIVQMLTRPGFDIHHNAISQLSLGDLGGIQIASFILTGLFAVLCGIGVRRALKGQKGGIWGALLFGTFGVGLIVAGIFPPDPGFGFPPGAPAGMPAAMTGHASGHAAGFFVSMLSAIAGSIIFARRFRALNEPGWMAYCIASAVAAPVLIVLTNVLMSWAGVIVALAGAVVFGWAAATAARLRSELSRA